MTSTQGLLGILKIGTILPNDRIGLPDDFPAAAFFSLLKHTRSQMSAKDVALQCARLFKHSKQQSGVNLNLPQSFVVVILLFFQRGPT